MDSERECPAGHVLTKWRNRNSTLRCDGECGEPLNEGSWRWSCAICDHDLCVNCADNLLTKQQKARAPFCPPVVSEPVPAPPPAASTAAKPPRAKATNNGKATAGVSRTPFPGAPAAAEETPSMGTARDTSGIYTAPVLDSVKRDLDGAFPAGSAAAAAAASNKRQQRAQSRRQQLDESEPALDQAEIETNYAALVKASRCGLPRYDDDGEEDAETDHAYQQSMLPSLTPQKLLIQAALTEASVLLPHITLDEKGKAPNLLSGLPPLQALRLPPPIESRMLSRRAWLQSLLQDELAREARFRSGHLSAFDLATGVTVHAAETPDSRAQSVLTKFHTFRSNLLREELLEIETLQHVIKA